jgi:hypothetical protein
MYVGSYLVQVVVRLLWSDQGTIWATRISIGGYKSARVG